MCIRDRYWTDSSCDALEQPSGYWVQRAGLHRQRGQELDDLVHGCWLKFGQRQHVPWDDDWRGCCIGGRTDLGDLVYEELGEVVSTELVGGRLRWQL